MQLHFHLSGKAARDRNPGLAGEFLTGLHALPGPLQVSTGSGRGSLPCMVPKPGSLVILLAQKHGIAWSAAALVQDHVGAEAQRSMILEPGSFKMLLVQKYSVAIEARSRMLELVPPGRVIFLRPLKTSNVRTAWDAVWVKAEEVIREV